MERVLMIYCLPPKQFVVSGGQHVAGWLRSDLLVVALILAFAVFVINLLAELFAIPGIDSRRFLRADCDIWQLMLAVTLLEVLNPEGAHDGRFYCGGYMLVKVAACQMRMRTHGIVRGCQAVRRQW